MSAQPVPPEPYSVRASLRPCCRRESARIGASLQTSESLLSDAQSELTTVKRRLRKYAHALDAVSKSAKEEIHVALEARNAALTQVSSIAAERDNLSKNCDQFASQLKSQSEQSADLKRRFDVNNTCLTKAVSEVSRLRNELERSKRASSDLRVKLIRYEQEKSNLSANLTSEKLSKRGLMEERDALQDDLNMSNSEVVALKRELALVKHQLETRNPPEVSKKVRNDIAERSASAVERRTVNIIKTLAKHFLEFKADQKEILQPENVHADTDNDASIEDDASVSTESIQTENVAKQFIPAADGNNRNVPNEDIEQIGDIMDADVFLEKYIASIKQATAEADSMFPSSVLIDSAPGSSREDDDSDETEEDEYESSEDETDQVQRNVVASMEKSARIDKPSEPTSVIVRNSLDEFQ